MFPESGARAARSWVWPRFEFYASLASPLASGKAAGAKIFFKGIEVAAPLILPIIFNERKLPDQAPDETEQDPGKNVPHQDPDARDSESSQPKTPRIDEKIDQKPAMIDPKPQPDPGKINL